MGMKPLFFISFGICLLCYLTRTLYELRKMIPNLLPIKKINTKYISVVMGILWFSWFQMCFLDPVRLNIPDGIRYTGLLIFLTGVPLFVLSQVKLKGFEKRQSLITTGIYSKIRNPMYLGFIFWLIGFPVFMKSLVTLLSSVLWISFIIYWKLLEERQLMKKHKSYHDYKKNTWF